MALIHKLPPDVASRVAAGEVVERPFNVVKELVENSCDAGASKIVAEISDGGLSLIRIADNGSGISYDDLPLALERFATSKASSVEDVYSASTFGFRGEALAAISSVSDFTLTSGTSSGKTYQIKSNYGVISNIRPAPFIEGTVIEVKNLFENVPARRKYLKNFHSLNLEIVRFVKYFSIINPQVEIELYSNGKLIYEAGSNDDICMRASKVFVDKGFCFGSSEYGAAKAFTAAVLPASCDRLKRDGIIIGVNGRLIKDQTLIQAVIRSYYRLIPEGRYPCAAVNLRINPEEVDSNVHPAKLEVRFEKPKDIFTLVSESVSSSFKGKGASSEYDAIYQPYSNSSNDNEKLKSERSSAAYIAPSPINIISVKEPSNFYGSKSPSESYEENNINKTLKEDNNTVSLYENNSEEFSFQPAKKNNNSLKSFHVIGQVANTYIICETDDLENLIFIDQHAAHERILFEEKQERAKREKMSVVLYEPIVVSLTSEEISSAIDNIDIIESYGYAFEKLSDTSVSIKRIPHISAKNDVAQLFKNIVSELFVSGVSKTEDSPRALLSCKSAIKAGDHLSFIEMKYLAELLFKTDNYGTCPHGRPIIYTMSINELGRKFLR